MKRKIVLLLVTSTLLSFSGKENFYQGFNLKAFEKSLSLLPEGSFSYGQSDQDVPYLHQPKSRVISLDTFYMYKQEVSNGEYLEFMNDLKKKDTALFRSMLPDTLVWREKLNYMEKYVDYYLRHPAYSNHPVVGITYEQAEYYCSWLTEKYMNEGKRKFKNVAFNLATTEQWTFAAKGRLKQAVFPWEGFSMQNKKGEWLANFTVIPQSAIGWSTFPVQNVYGQMENKKIRIAGDGYRSGGYLNVESDITAPVISYYPNDFGLYNMAGNVEEYVKEKGVTKGGSWRDTGYYLYNHVEEHYDSTNYTSAERGFRFVMEIKK
jgi:sulfatase modifying factor 1